MEKIEAVYNLMQPNKEYTSYELWTVINQLSDVSLKSRKVMEWILTILVRMKKVNKITTRPRKWCRI